MLWVIIVSHNCTCDCVKEYIVNQNLLLTTVNIQGISRVIMSPTELKMQPTIHWHCKPGLCLRPYSALISKCIVGCIFNSVGLIITREISGVSKRTDRRFSIIA
jgi:hypothetical protein